MRADVSFAGLAALLLFTGCGEKWSVVLEKQPGALIAVWGTSASDVWAVGGDSGNGPEVLRYDGRQWSRLDSQVRGDLWWVYGPPGGPVFFGGSKGLLLRFKEGAFETLAPPKVTAATVFGLWGPSADDLWAVGGDGNGSAFAWRFDGTTWRDVPLPAGLESTRSLFKVWGRSATDVWFVGSRGLCLHWDGTKFDTVPTPTNRTLFTLHGVGQRLTAVGGFGTAVVLEHDGSAWVDVSPPQAKQAIGVRLTEKGAWAVGVNGSVLVRDEKGWRVDEPGPSGVFDDLHAVWVDPAGGVWAVGGQVAATPLVNGVLAYRGGAPPAATVR